MEPAVHPPRRIFLLEKEHTPPSGNLEAPADVEAEREAQGFFERVVRLAELFLATEPAAAVVGKEAVDVGLRLRERLGEEFAEADTERLGARFGRRSRRTTVM